MESKETNNGDDIPTSTSPPPTGEEVRSNSSPNEQGNFDWIVDEGAVNVNNPMLQPHPADHQDYHIYRKVMYLVLIQKFARFKACHVEHRFPLVIQEEATLPLSWFHVTCNNDNKVTRLDLGNYGFQGSLVPQLGSLPNLQYLEIYSNQINGSIPAELGNLTNLLSLDLYENQLSGPIPDLLGHLKALLFMRLNDNKLTGTVPQSVKALTNGNLRILIGLKRHLTLAEIVERAVFTWCLLSSEVGSISNVVFMVRNWIMSINWNCKQGLLLETLREELRFKHNYKVLFEYVMLAVINDRINSSRCPSRTTGPDSSFPTQNTDFLSLIPDCCGLDCSSSFTLGQGIYTLSCGARHVFFFESILKSWMLVGNFGQSQTIAPIQPASRLTSPAYTFGWMRMGSGVDHDFNLGQKIQLNLKLQCASNVDLDKPPQPSGRGCFFCKRDLSFTPEADGPISQPSIPPSVGVLPCGHYFHSRCLEIVTPPEKSTDPCILCDLDENASRRPIFSQVFSVPFSISNLSGISQNIGGLKQIRT
ncbi:hypothetical protein Pint_30384 [Pistacia integerrima]|uniref:Uncharacterized protein n=1 Tax=Pistacia integerrima TaxID=434235 RepID=A0ACC0WYT6_9ROSI|nr:hypothetical protein Pint_30384 [Pistacia integerrima]